MLSREQQKTERKGKLLFAPSWRSYLVGENVRKDRLFHKRNGWELLDERFLSSVWYRKIQAFLEMDELYQLLRENDSILEVKLHPIFQDYLHHFHAKSERIVFVQKSEPEEYDLLITDFSSYLFDFVYQGIPVISFIPDDVEFRAGMNGYRMLNWTEEFWAARETEPEALIRRIQKFFEDGTYVPFGACFFSHGNARENIYRALCHSLSLPDLL